MQNVTKHLKVPTCLACDFRNVMDMSGNNFNYSHSLLVYYPFMCPKNYSFSVDYFNDIHKDGVLHR